MLFLGSFTVHVDIGDHNPTKNQSINTSRGINIERPYSSKSLSDFINNPGNTTEPINPKQNKSVINGGFELYNEYNEYLTNFVDYRDYSCNYFFFNCSSERTTQGTYALRLEVRSTYDSSVFQRIYQNMNQPDCIINENGTFGFDWYALQVASDQNNSDSQYVQVELNNSINFRYYIMGHAQNNSITRCIPVENFNNTGSWHTSSRNLTQDYLNAFGSFTEDIAVEQISIYGYQRQNREIKSVAFYDQLSLKIKGTEELPNGNFETSTGGDNKPDFWTGNDRDPSRITWTDFSYQGNSALNMSNEITPAVESESYTMCSSNIGKYFNAHSNQICQERPAFLSLDYYINDKPVLNNRYSVRIYLEFENNTDTKQINLYLMDPNFDSRSNYTNSYSYKINNFNQNTGAWRHMDIDLLKYLEPVSYGYPMNLSLIQIYQTNNGRYEGTLEMYWDNLNLEISMFTDPGFENLLGDAQTTPIRGFEKTGMDSAYSDSAYKGNYCANFTNGGGSEGNSIENVNLGFSELEQDTHIQFTYNIPDYKVASPEDVLALGFYIQYPNSSDYHTLSYVLGGGNNVISATNQTNQGLYLISSFNQTESWITVSRNLYRDYEAIFESKKTIDYIISGVMITINSNQNGNQISLLLDDIDFGTGTPVNEGLSVSDSAPSYLDTVDFSLDLFESGTGIADCIFFYDLDGDKNEKTWQSINMDEVDEDEQEYLGSLSQTLLDYGNTVTYYFQYSDMLENKGTYPKEGEQAPLSLYVDDFSAPILNNLSVVPKTSNINTTLKFKVNASDGEGSGIKNVTVQYSIDEMKTWQEVELVSNGSESKIYNNSIPGFQNNTIFIFYAILEDNEGNIYNSSLEGYEYGFVADSDKLNPPPPKETGKNIGIGIGIGAVALLGLEGLIKFVIERRKKK